MGLWWNDSGPLPAFPKSDTIDLGKENSLGKVNHGWTNYRSLQ